MYKLYGLKFVSHAAFILFAVGYNYCMYTVEPRLSGHLGSRGRPDN